MPIEYSFPRYLLSKQSVDDRALNKDVFNMLKASLPDTPLRIIEVGAGIGTMVKRLVAWDFIHKAEYVLVDEMAENIEYASVWIPAWAEESGLSVERSAQNQIQVFDKSRDIKIQLEQADVFDFIQKNKSPADLLIAHAFLDLLPMPESLAKLFTLTNSLAWLTLVFDGVTTLEPSVDAVLDEKIEMLYHRTMEESRSGRRMFTHIKHTGADVLAAGASDWVAHGVKGKYPQDETYFLNFILLFFEKSLKGHKELSEKELVNWLAKRRGQIEQGELAYIAHQLDFLVKIK